MNRLHLLVCLFSLLVLASCSSNSDTPVPASGLLSGTVQLWDDKTSTLSDNSGVMVAVEDVAGTTTTTDAAGKYSFSSLPYGLHDLTFSKSGYGTYKLFGVMNASSASGTIIPAVQMGKLATTTVTSLSISGNTYNGSPGISVLYAVAPKPSPSSRGLVRYFLSTDASVSNTNYTYASPTVSILNNDATGGFTREDLFAAGFTTGQTIYLRLYGESFQSNTYTDPNVGKRMYPNINTTTVPAVSFVMP